MIGINFNKSSVYYAQNISSSLTTSPGHFGLLFHSVLPVEVLPHSACVIQVCFYLQENASSVTEAKPAAAVGEVPGLGCAAVKQHRSPTSSHARDVRPWLCSWAPPLMTLKGWGEAVLSGSISIGKHRLHL